MQVIWVQSLGLKDPLEKKMATHSSILPWGIPWTEEPGRIQSLGSQRVEHNQLSKKACECLWKVKRDDNQNRYLASVLRK